jgi:two-component system sensor histidine kinase MprB
VTLRWRIALILAVVAFGVGALAATASYLSTASQLRSGIDDTLRSRAAAANLPTSDVGRRNEHDGGDGGTHPASTTGCPTAGAFSPASAAQIVTPTGVVTACIGGGKILPTEEEDRAVPAGTVRLRTVNVDGEKFRILTTRWQSGGTLMIGRSLAESEPLLSRLRLRLGALVALATALAAGLGWAVANWLARPIARLRDAAHNIATTLDLTTPIDIDASGEVGSLASSFSTMVAAVRRSQEQQRRLVADASHEMRTPLTSLRSNLELLGKIERLPQAERSEVISDVLDDVDELSTLLGELVDLASDLATAEPEEQVRLGDLSRAVAARTQRRTERAVTVVESDATCEVTVRPRQIERAISNLVDNAVKYSAPDQPIEVVIDGTTLQVRDGGRGIPEGDLERIFDRFYRALDTRGEPGSGLGLSIVAEIVRSHGGDVFARNRAGGGAEVGFALKSATDGHPPRPGAPSRTRRHRPAAP